MSIWKKFNYGLTGFFIGGAVGTALTILFAPKSGRELRSDINSGFNGYKDKALDSSRKLYDSAVDESKKVFHNAISAFNDVVKKSDQLRSLSTKYLTGAYTVPKGRIEHEIASLKRALKAAIDAYRESPERNDINDDLVRDIASEFENDTLPKFEGMGRRFS